MGLFTGCERALPALALSLWVVLGACAHPPAPARANASAAAPNLHEGRRLAEINCASCHAIGVEGESRHPEAPPFRTFSRDYPVTMLQEAFAEGILVGHPAMPEFRLEPQQIDDLLAYIESVQERRGG